MSKKKKYKSYNDAVNSQGPEEVSARYISWAGKDVTEQQEAFEELGRATDAFIGISHANYGHRDLSDLDTNISGRNGLTHEQYGYFRPEEAVPRKMRDIQIRADVIYNRVGIIRNIVDLMGDFCCQGIRIVHPNKRIEKWCNNWAKRTGFMRTSERFCNMLYRLGTVPMRRQTAKITLAQKERLYKSIAQPDTEIEKINQKKAEIPWRYTFLNPATIEVVGGPLASFSGKNIYAMKIPDKLRRMISSPATPEEAAIVADLPPEYIRAAQTNKPVILDREKTRVFSYKKDDWQQFAFPMIYAIMDDIVLLRKLKLADMAALDGAISNIRIFKLGSLEHQIAPTRAVVSKLSEILESHPGGGTMDLIWGPDIELIESKTQIHQFLGEAKYVPVYNAIYAGLGIPPTLTGMAGASGTTNNFISLQTLVQRLEYGRQMLCEFWAHELELLRQAMGFRFAPKLEFENTDLGDPKTEKALLIQLADRNLISDELLQHRFGNDPEMERIRLNREQKDRENDRMVPKSGPYHDPQFTEALKKIFAQTGVVTPSELGVELEDKKDGQKPMLEMRQPPAAPGGNGGPPSKKSGQPQQGRPKNSTDTKTRETKTFKPKSKALLEIWAGQAQKAISEYLNPFFLEHFEKKNMRSLTASEADEAEIVRFGVLCNLEPMGEIDEDSVVQVLSTSGLPKPIEKVYNTTKAQISEELDRALTLDECRKIQTAIYADKFGE